MKGHKACPMCGEDTFSVQVIGERQYILIPGGSCPCHTIIGGCKKCLISL